MFSGTMSVIFLALVASAVARDDRAPKQLRGYSHCGPSAQRRSISLQAACTLFGERADSRRRDGAGPADFQEATAQLAQEGLGEHGV